MANRLRDWSINGNILEMREYVKADSDKTGKLLVEYDITKLYPNFKEYNEVQKFIIVYGLKQKLADEGSSCKGDLQGMIDAANEKWQMFLDNKLVGVRANSTGAKENKRLADGIRESSKVISLSGLVMKKSQFPDEFTPEDQEKLDKFFLIMAEDTKKKKEAVAAAAKSKESVKQGRKGK